MSFRISRRPFAASSLALGSSLLAGRSFGQHRGYPPVIPGSGIRVARTGDDEATGRGRLSLFVVDADAPGIEAHDRIVLWALERDRERRPATAALLADALDLVLRNAGREGSPAYMMRWLDFQWEQARPLESGMIGLDPDTEIAITIDEATGS